ncbi:hypothetical protein MJD09_03170, partial [bacterium]|nr:hypothetical protein [bacterium]
MAVSFAGAGEGPQGQHSKGVAELISLDRINTHLTILAHDSLQGRGTGTIGGARAAHYLATQLHKLGLKPAGGEGTYFQAVPLHGSTPLTTSNLTIVSRDSSVHLKLWQDYVLYNSGAQTFIPTPLPLIFVGYGIFAPEYDYNDYGGLDVENSIVVFLSGEPSSEDPNYFDGPRGTIYSDPLLKYRLALSRGARGGILIPSSKETKFQKWDNWVLQF